MRLRSDLVATFAVSIAALVWGCWWMPLRVVEQAGLTGAWPVVAFYVLGGLVLLPFAAARRHRFRAAGRSLATMGALFGISLAVWSHGIIHADVIRVTLLFYLSPVWATLLARFVLQQRLTVLRVLSLLLGLTGAATVLGSTEGVPVPRSEGEWMGLAAGVFFALGATVSRKNGDSGGFEQTFLCFAFAAATALILVAAMPAGPAPSLAVLLDALPVLLAATVLLLVPSMWLVLWGASRLDPGRVSLLLLFEVVAAAVTAALWTDEPFGWRETAGCALILAAGAADALHQLRRPGTVPAPAS